MKLKKVVLQEFLSRQTEEQIVIFAPFGYGGTFVINSINNNELNSIGLKYNKQQKVVLVNIPDYNLEGFEEIDLDYKYKEEIALQRAEARPSSTLTIKYFLNSKNYQIPFDKGFRGWEDAFIPPLISKK